MRASSSTHYSPFHYSLIATKLNGHFRFLPARGLKTCSLALIPLILLLLLLQPVSILATTPDNNDMEKLNSRVSCPATIPNTDQMERLKLDGVRREVTGRVGISLYDQGESHNEDPNLTRDEGDEEEKAVTCRLLPFGDCCQGWNNELFDNAKFDQADGWTGFAISTGNDRDPCGILLSSTKDWNTTCLAGDEHWMTIFGAAAGADNSGGGKGGGNDASIQAKRGAGKPKKRAVRADWYTFTFRGMRYHIRMNSSLGETYRNLATKAEQREFAMEHGEPEPVVGRRVRAAR